MDRRPFFALPEKAFIAFAKRESGYARSRLDLRRPPLLLSPKYMLSKLRRLVGVRRLAKTLIINVKNRRMIESNR